VAKPKSLILPLSADRALRGHTCQHSSKHPIAKGDLRLKIAIGGRSPEYYCVACAQTFIAQAIERLQKLSAELEG
jgi:hypothetical protein